MFTPRLPKIRSSAWSKVVGKRPFSTAVEEPTKYASRGQLQQEEAKSKQQPRIHQAAQDGTPAMKASKPADISVVSEGVQIVVNTMEAVSIGNKANPVLVLPPDPPEQTIEQTANMTTRKLRDGPRQQRDAKADPSSASGGIPDPSEEYFRACMYGPSLLRQPQHLLVVIDLNGTLLYRPNKKNPTQFRMRPHAQTFLKYCVDTFTVVIWSSARPGNVNAMCKTILTPDIRDKVAAIWGRDRFGLSKQDYDLRTQCYKRLSKIWEDPKIAGRHPGYYEGRRWDQTNTVLIDDSREKARTEPHNLIEVPEYLGDLRERDDILPQVHDYLNHLSRHSNVSACLHKHPWKPRVDM